MRLKDVKVKLKVYSGLREVIGKNLIELDVADGSTVHDFLSELEARYPTPLFKEGGYVEAITKYFNVFLNGKSIKLPNDLNVKLNDMDEIVILQASIGG